MAKESAVKLETVWTKNAVVCQCCKQHANKPSYCNQLNKHVGRKADASKCEGFARA